MRKTRKRAEGVVTLRRQTFFGFCRADQRRFYKKLIASADVRFDGHLAAIKAAGVSKQVKEKERGKKSE